MKNKILRSLTALCAAFMLVGSFSVTAFAQTPADTTNDSNVVVEQPQEDTPPLTPEGNATLVDDYGGNKQLITVTTKSGNYFYILVDRAAEGENTVHFLNQVDEADLMALMENGEATQTPAPAVCNCTEKCEAGAVNTACPVCSANRNSCTGKEAAPEETEQPKEKSNASGLILFLVVALIGGGAALYYFKVMKPKQNTKGSTDLDDFEFDEYDEDEPEEEADDSDTEQEDEEE